MSPKADEFKKELEALKARSAETDKQTEALTKEAAVSVEQAEIVKRRLLKSR